MLIKHTITRQITVGKFLLGSVLTTDLRQKESRMQSGKLSNIYVTGGMIAKGKGSSKTIPSNRGGLPARAVRVNGQQEVKKTLNSDCGELRSVFMNELTIKPHSKTVDLSENCSHFQYLLTTDVRFLEFMGRFFTVPGPKTLASPHLPSNRSGNRFIDHKFQKRNALGFTILKRWCS